jgi:hypothetical protein
MFEGLILFASIPVFFLKHNLEFHQIRELKEILHFMLKAVDYSLMGVSTWLLPAVHSWNELISTHPSVFFRNWRLEGALLSWGLLPGCKLSCSILSISKK